MSSFSASRRVPYAAGHVLAIVADVGSYPEFMPLVKKAIIRNCREVDGARRAFDASVAVAYDRLGISETLFSHVVVDEQLRTVTATSDEGAVKSLKAVWTISDEGEGTCAVHLAIDYVMQSRPLQFVLAGVIDLVARKIMAAFEERAAKLYASAS